MGSAMARTIGAWPLGWYTRWNHGQLDIFYLVEGGYVVYDLLTASAISEPWEFD